MASRMELPFTANDMEHLTLSYELSTSSRARIKAWWQSIRAPRLICALLRAYWKKLEYGVLTVARFLRRTIGCMTGWNRLFRKAVWGLCICVMMGIFSIIWLDVLQGSDSTHTNQFEALKGYALPFNNVSSISSDSLGICLRDSGENLTIVFDASPFVLNRCQRLEHTPFYYDLSPELRKTSTIYIRSDALNGGKKHEDGFFYYIQSFPHIAELADEHCQLHSDFYRLALYEKKAHTIGLAREHMDPYGHHYPGVLIQSVTPVRKLDYTCSGQLEEEYVKQYVRVRAEDVQHNVGPSTLGHVLCQGDPFNLMNDSVSLFRKSLDWRFPPRSLIEQRNDIRILAEDHWDVLLNVEEL